MTPASLVELQNVNVTIAKREILSGIDLRVRTGEIVSLIGHNGAGKSTLLKSLNGLVAVTGGQAKVLGRDLARPLTRRALRALRADIGLISQGLHLVPRLTVFQNVLIGRLGRNVSWWTWANYFTEEDHAISRRALEHVKMSHFADRRTDGLSGGERQKVAVARALAQEARLLLADEPTSNLDPRAALAMCDSLKGLAQDHGLGVVAAVHSLRLVRHLGGRAVGLREGRIEFDIEVEKMESVVVDAFYGRPAHDGA